MTHSQAIEVRSPNVPLSTCSGKLRRIASDIGAVSLYRCSACGAQLLIEHGMVSKVTPAEADPKRGNAAPHDAPDS
jgi:hypothetical protein